MSDPAKRALLSVTDKTGIVDFAQGLVAQGYEIVSTGGTARALEEGGVTVRALSDFTGWPEMLDGRVKTLHPKVHAGILARRDDPKHQAQMAEHDLGTIDVVGVNLYNFAGAVERNLAFEDLVEEIDIGGPTLLRAAAKNHKDVVVVCTPDRYGEVLERLASGACDATFRRALAGEVFAHTARYDAEVARHILPDDLSDAPPVRWSSSMRRQDSLRYGENPHQQAAFYVPEGQPAVGLSAAVKLQGKELSYNNLLDLDAALGLAIDLAQLGADPAAVYIKHNNPCGAATQATVADALRIARDVDSLSAFGSVVAVSAPLDEEAATVLTESFVEAVIAPSITAEARPILAKKKNLRVLELSGASHWQPKTQWEPRVVQGGLLVQSKDTHPDFVKEAADAKTATQRDPSAEERAGLAFAWAAAKHVRSNAIVFAKRDRLVAVGAGQMSRVDSVKICKLKAGDALRGSVVASDAFFPFRDGVDVLAEAGATAIIQPGGSKRDGEVVTAADEHGVAMLFTGVRHFRH